MSAKHVPKLAATVTALSLWLCSSVAAAAVNSASPGTSPSPSHSTASSAHQETTPTFVPTYSSRVAAIKAHTYHGPVRRTSAPLATAPSQAGTNVLVSYQGQVDFAETAVSYDPIAHANLEAGANNVTNASSFPGGFYTTNSGTSWGITNPNPPTAPPNTFGSDPGIAFDGSGNLYYSFISGNSDASSLELVVQLSTTQGASWTAPVIVDGPNSLVDKPLDAADTTSGSPFYNRKYLGYDYANGFLYVAYSDDGIKWSRTQVATSTKSTLIGAYPVVDRNGNVLLAWDDLGDVSGGQILVSKSTNGGASFGSQVVVASTTIGGGVTIPNWSNGRNPAKLLATPSFDVDRTFTTVTAGYMYMVWNDEQPVGTGMHIYFSRSTDGGATWSAPVRLDAGNPNDAWEPTVAVDQLDGTVKVAWYDRRDDSGNKFYNVYYTQSTDGGLTFLPQQIRVTDAQSDPTLFVDGTGDYMQMVSVDGVAHPVWADTRNSSGATSVIQIFTAAVNENLYASACFGQPMAGNATPHTVAIRNSDGTVWSFGYNAYGDLGYSTLPSDHSDVPGQTQGLPSGRAEAVSAGGNTGMAIMPGGTVWAWGGGLTNGGASVPYQVGALSNVISLSQGSLALEGDGSVWTISGTTASRVSGLPYIVKIAGAATSTAYALDTQGQVWAWGANDSGQLGNGQTSGTPTTTPARVKAPKGSSSTYLLPVRNIAAGSSYALAVLSSGLVYAWGSNAFGQLGNGTSGSSKNSSLPVRSGTLATATDVASAGLTSAALMGDGSVQTWGYDHNGELGDGNSQHLGSFTTTPGPVSIPTGTTFNAIAGGSLYFTAETSGGAMWAWGDNYWGNLGIGPGAELNLYNSAVQSSMAALPIAPAC